MLHAKKLGKCAALLCLAIPLYSATPAVAEEIPTVMDGLTYHVIAMHPDFESKVQEAGKAGLSAENQALARQHEKIVYEQAQQWQDSLKGESNRTRDQVLSYDDTFNRMFDEIIDALAADDEDGILERLDNMQDDVTTHKGAVTQFLDDLRTYKSDIGKNVSLMQADIDKIENLMDGYRASLDKLYDKLSEDLDDVVRSQIEEETYDLSVKIYDQLEPLSMHLSTLASDIKGVDDGVLNIGWLVTLEDMNTGWSRLDSALKNLIGQVKETETFDEDLFRADMETTKTLWTNIYRQAQQL
ncbi:HBL/NHE enterotoxin family protein [Bacillus sp. FSL W7-1360]